MTGKQTTVLLLGIALIMMQFYAGGQWKILFGVIKPSGSTPSSSTGPSGKCPPGFVFDPVHKVCVKHLVM